MGTGDLARPILAGANILCMYVIKRAQEIQKLAKSVQDKMRNTY